MITFWCSTVAAVELPGFLYIALLPCQDLALRIIQEESKEPVFAKVAQVTAVHIARSLVYWTTWVPCLVR